MRLGLSCRIDRSEVLRYLGYRGQQLDEALERRLDAAIERCEDGCPPAGTFAMFPLERATEEGGPALSVQGAGVVLEGADIARFLEGATHCALMAVTLGAQRERELQRRTALNPIDALLYDAACSAYTEAAADELQRHVGEVAAQQGLEMLPGRFSPGYGDLPIDVQKPLLVALDAYRTLGLAVTENCLLVPRKSVTALVGLRKVGGFSGTGAPAAPPAPSAKTCETCNLVERCAFRREGGTCHD